jgi:hypothetical protein
MQGLTKGLKLKVFANAFALTKKQHPFLYTSSQLLSILFRVFTHEQRDY